MISIVDRLRFDATRCEVQFSKGVASNIEEAADEIERLARNRDMWKGQCERQAEQLTNAHAALRDCASFIISPVRHSDDDTEAKRRRAIYDRAQAALRIQDYSHD